MACKATILRPHEQWSQTSFGLDLKKKKLILFDLGGVIINLDWDLSFNAVSKLFKVEKDELISMIQSHPLFLDLEVGKISGSGFWRQMQIELGISFSFEDLSEAFNLMLLDIPEERIQLIESLRAQGLMVACLSNTNQFHMDRFNEILGNSGSIKSINELMDFVFLSHEIGYKKPDALAFETVMRKTKTGVEDILFFDDLKENVEAGLKIGIESHLVKTQTVNEILGL